MMRLRIRNYGSEEETIITIDGPHEFQAASAIVTRLSEMHCLVLEQGEWVEAEETVL